MGNRISKAVSGIDIMNVLVVASTDSYNQSLLQISEELKKAAHDVLILFTHQEDAHNHMLFNDEIKTTYWYEFDEYTHYDAVIYGNILNGEVLSKVLSVDNLKISVFFHLVIDEYVLGGAHLYADFTLCFGQRFMDNQYKNGIEHNLISVGIPFESGQADHSDKKEKIILLLEQHFYPSGSKGKRQLADFLLELARAKKEYKIIVKPRALENEQGTKHKAEHLYNYFEKLPENLILLKKHLDLEELVSKADIVLTTFSTAVMPAIKMDKPVMFVYGFSMLETYFYNRQMVDRYYNIYRVSGSLIHYTNVISKLESALPIDKAFKDYMFHPRENDLFKSLVVFMEDAQKFKNIKIGSTTIDNYKQSFGEAEKRSVYAQINNMAIEEFYRINIITGFRLSHERNSLIRDLKILKEQELDLTMYKTKVISIKDDYIQKGFERIMGEYTRFPIGFKGLYLKYLYDHNMETKMSELPKNWHIADYYYNRYLFARNKKEESAKKYLLRYLLIAKKAKYRFTHLYEDNAIENAEKILKIYGS